MKSRLLIVLPIFLLYFRSALAQGELKLPDDANIAGIARAKYALLTDLKNAGKFKEASPHLSWLLKNTPEIHYSIYVNGAQIYDAMATEANKTKKRIYQDSCMLIHDLRIKYFGDKANVLNRKAAKAYKYYLSDVDKHQEVLTLFKEVYELNGNNVFDINTIGYFSIVHRYKLAGGNITESEILDIFNLVFGVIDAKIQRGKNVEKLLKYKEKILAMLQEVVKIDCSFVENQLASKFKQEQDLITAKIIVSSSLKHDCNTLPVVIQAAEFLYERNPDYGVALLIAFGHKENKAYGKAEKYFQEANELTEDNLKKADVNVHLGNIYALLNEKPKARNYYRNALAFDPNKKEAYGYIGTLYMSSFKECSKKNSWLEDRSVYLAAYKMFQLAGDIEGMRQSRLQFPSAEDLHGENKKVGESFKVGCWINETVQLDKRPNEF